jgi:hypothetical protein
MRNPIEIKSEIGTLTERRAEVLHLLSEGHDEALSSEHRALEERIAELWDEHRHARVAYRFGDRNTIIRRARHEERLSRAA